jgi:DNA-binding NarL/FixJ family response regulator
MVVARAQKDMTMDRIRVMIVDDHLKYRMALLVALSEEPSLEIVEEASDGNEAVEKAKAVRPDVILMDLHMPECNGDDATRRPQAEVPGTNVVINTISDQESDLVNALKCGARGYLLKNEDTEMVVQAMHYVARGGIMVSPAMAAKLVTEIQTPSTQAAATEPAPPETGPLMNHSAVSQAREEARADAATERLASMSVYATDNDSDKDPDPNVIEKPTPVTPLELDTRVMDAELIIGAPMEPAMVLKLHQWLMEEADGIVEKVIPSMTGDTVLAIHLNEALPIWRLMRDLPFVDDMSADQQADSAQEMTKRDQSRRKFRLSLKAA